jgi:hypothetical protein
MFPSMEFPGKRGRHVAETVQTAVRQAGALVLTALLTALAALALSAVALAIASRKTVDA